MNSPSPGEGVVVAVDQGGTKTAVGVVDATGSLQPVTTQPTPGHDGPAALLDHMAELVAQAVAATDRPVRGVGVGTAGTVDLTTGRIVSSTDALAGWAGTDVVAELRRRIPVPGGAGRGPDAGDPAGPDWPLVVVNDVAAHAAGEWWQGAGRGYRHGLLVAVGTGIGGAVVVDGKLWGGGHGLAGQHMGHIPVAEAAGMRCPCGGEGHLEAIASGPAIARRYRLRAAAEGDGKGNGEVVDTREVRRRAEAGEGLALEVMGQAAVVLGRVVAGLVATFDPEVVVIGGGMAGAGPTWWEPLRAALGRELLPIQKNVAVVPAALTTGAALVGAARTVWQRLED